MTAESSEWNVGRAAALLEAPDTDSHKYSRGVLGLRTGSNAYPGAAVLSAEAAWRTGIGLVRYSPPLDDEPQSLGLPSPAAAVLAVRPETVFSAGDDALTSRVDAWAIGSGTDPARRSFAEQQALERLLTEQNPVVVDAGALDLVARRSTNAHDSAPIIITPHRGEFARLWARAELQAPIPDSADEAAAALAKALGVTVLLKGSRTVVVSPGAEPITCGPATPLLATAGTGDVLAGILGALVATHADDVRNDATVLAQLGATAAMLHDLAARIASKGGGPITALDVAHAVPDAIRSMTEGLR